MSGAIEDDIYDDLYGDSADVKDLTQAPSPAVQRYQESQSSQSQHEETKPPTGVSLLPAKPSQSSELSYSAQIAQQFSAYKQTPAQERQSRPSTLQGGNDSSSAHSQDGRRAVRPSEMKDEG
ncbi:hypothetical protein DAEQUDRAFT_700377 [Daedalea quercina L-15889]|uniref:Uncharacterized protein n=1 Tax=Daedalea quercina L-15889 TaxID=1314783 RepID=A0A165KJH4_9APHY|nr:hypothetical protein DAEQUDRAFT_700377 [Daedalea quercina L-15889]